MHHTRGEEIPSAKKSHAISLVFMVDLCAKDPFGAIEFYFANEIPFFFFGIFVVFL